MLAALRPPLPGLNAPLPPSPRKAPPSNSAGGNNASGGRRSIAEWSLPSAPVGITFNSLASTTAGNPPHSLASAFLTTGPSASAAEHGSNTFASPPNASANVSHKTAPVPFSPYGKRVLSSQYRPHAMDLSRRPAPKVLGASQFGTPQTSAPLTTSLALFSPTSAANLSAAGTSSFSAQFAASVSGAPPPAITPRSQQLSSSPRKRPTEKQTQFSSAKKSKRSRLVAKALVEDPRAPNGDRIAEYKVLSIRIAVIVEAKGPCTNAQLTELYNSAFKPSVIQPSFLGFSRGPQGFVQLMRSFWFLQLVQRDPVTWNIDRAKVTSELARDIARVKSELEAAGKGGVLSEASSSSKAPASELKTAAPAASSNFEEIAKDTEDAPPPPLDYLARFIGQNTGQSFTIDRERKLGEGGFGQVFVATQGDGVEYAVKVLFTQFHRTLKLTQREKDIMASMDHPHLIKLIDMATVAYAVLLVMPKYDMSLERFVKKAEGGRLPEDKIKLLAKQIVLGMEYMHSYKEGIIHRDLKPANVLIKEEREQIGVCDFGFSRKYYAGCVSQSAGMGTTPYMAWELKRNGRFFVGYTTAVDVFSLGCVLFFMATGDHPEVDIDAPPRAHSLGEDVEVSQELRALITECTAVDYKQRPTMADLLKRSYFEGVVVPSDLILK